MTMNPKAFLRGPLPLGEGTRLGARFARPIFNLAEHSEEGEALLRFYLQAEKVALWSSNERTYKVFDRAAQRLDKFASSAIKGDDLAFFRREIEQRNHTIVSRWWSEGAPMPESARFKAVLTDPTRVSLSLESARSHSVFKTRLFRLIKASPSPAELMAFTTYRRMLNVIGNELDDGWSRVFDYCAKHAQEIAEKAKKLHNVEDEVAELPAAAANEILSRAQYEARSFFYPIRGELAEIYLHHWPDWRIQMSSLEELADGVARKLPGNWTPEQFSGGALIDGKKAWDEGILLIKAPSSSDRLPRAVLHTSAQVKVENNLTALDQIVTDRLREIGTSFEAPTLSIIRGGFRRDFVLEASPSGASVSTRTSIPRRSLCRACSSTCAAAASGRCTRSTTALAS